MARGGVVSYFAGEKSLFLSDFAWEKSLFFEPLDPCLDDFAEYIDGDWSSGRD